MLTRDFRLKTYKARLQTHPTVGEFREGMTSEDVEVFLEDMKGEESKEGQDHRYREALEKRSQMIRCQLRMCEETKERWREELEKVADKARGREQQKMTVVGKDDEEGNERGEMN
jgi:hypothetical protein